MADSLKTEKGNGGDSDSTGKEVQADTETKEAEVDDDTVANGDNKGSDKDGNYGDDMSSLMSETDIKSNTGDSGEFVPENPVVDGRKLLQKAKTQDFEMVKQILTKSSKLMIDVTDEVGKTTLHHLCASKNSEEIIQLCIDKKPDLNLIDKMGWTPLHYATLKGQTEVVRMLAENGAKCNTPETQQGRTPLHLAVSRNHQNVVEVLLACGANPDVKDKSGKSAGDLSKNELMKDFLETAIENAMNALGEIQRETMDIPRNKPTPFPNLGIVVSPEIKSSEDASSLPGLKMAFRRVPQEKNEIDFEISDTEDICSFVYSYTIKCTDGTLEPTVMDITVPISAKPNANEDLVLKTDTKDEYFLNNVTEQNEKITCVASFDISTLSAFVVVCRPKQERFQVNKTGTRIKSAVDSRVQLDIVKGTFDQQVTVTLEITEPPTHDVLAKLLKDCPEIISTTSFYTLESGGHELSKPIGLKIPLPESYAGTDGKFIIMSMDEVPEKETPDCWQVIDTKVDIDGGRAEFSVSSFSVKVAIQVAPSVADSESSFGSLTTLRSNISRVFRKSRRKEHSITFFCMTRRVGTSNSFKVIVQCCKTEQKSSKVAYWEGEGYEHQAKREKEDVIIAVAKSRFRFTSKTLVMPDELDENLLEFHPKLDNYQGFVVKKQDTKASTSGVIEFYRLEKNMHDDGIDVYEQKGEKVSAVEITMLKFHPAMMEELDGRSFLTYKRMLQLQDGLGECWWKTLLLMEIPFKTIEDTLKKNPGNVEEKINGMLFEWREKHMSDKSRGLPILFSALCRCGRRSIVNDFQIDLRKWKNQSENTKDSFHAWLVTAYKFNLLVPTRYGAPMSDTFLAMLAGDIEPTIESAKALSLPVGAVSDILNNTKVYSTKGLRTMKVLVLFRQGIPDVVNALGTLLQALKNADMHKQWKYTVMTTKAWLKRASDDDSLKKDVQKLLNQIEH